jgi:hypothetical protein
MSGRVGSFCSLPSFGHSCLDGFCEVLQALLLGGCVERFSLKAARLERSSLSPAQQQTAWPPQNRTPRTSPFAPLEYFVCVLP